MFYAFRRIASRFSLRNISTKPSEFGQPTYVSHPHLVNKDELTPGIPSLDYEGRRRRLMDILPEKSMVVLLAAPVKYMSANIFYKYRQSSDFWYLTGFDEPNSAVILAKDSSRLGYKMTLFCSGTNHSRAKWEGASTSHPAAKTIFQVDSALPINDLPSHLKGLLPQWPNVYIDLPVHGSRQKSNWFLNYLPASLLSDTDGILDTLSHSSLKPLAPQLGKLRSIKSVAEQAIMRKATNISAQAHTKTMRFAQPGMSEGTLAAHFEYLCAVAGAQRPAYVPVVASGPNSLILHYTHNNQLIEDGELVLIDAGCEYNGYASDITRTFPASGIFTPLQRDLYSVVLSVQNQMVSLCSESAGHSLQDLHRQSCDIMRKELTLIGFNLGNDGDLERVLYPHYLGHPIGIDLHESAYSDRTVPLKAGMVITIEPGIYVPPTPRFPKHFHNMGIRIEDVVLVGQEHPTILSVSAPKEIVDIEGACQGLLGLQSY